MLLAIVCVAIVASVSVYSLSPAAPPDLADGNNLQNAHFYSHWAKGELVVLVRHVERCDHSTNPCLSPPEGITIKGQGMAIQMGQSFKAMGITNADIFHSPQPRTAQTSAFAFGKAGTSQTWLYECRHTMLNDVLKHKVDQRNLILVTHSECINQLEKSLNVSAPAMLDYGSSLIVAVDGNKHTASILGFLDAPSWVSVIARRP